MKRYKIAALLLSFALLIPLSPTALGTDASGTENAAKTASDAVSVFAASGWQPKPTRSVSSASAFPLTLNNGDVLQINGPINYTAPKGTSPITLSAGADAKIIINGSVTLKGADASGMTGATAAIRVPQGAKLTIFSAHDEELSASAAAPKDTLTVVGGNAAAGGNGTAGKKVTTDDDSIQQRTINWYTGSGGNGGGGAAAAIGGNGGNGGVGGSGGKSPQEISSRTWSGTTWSNVDDHHGAAGNKGAAGASGGSAGIINISGRLRLNASGGSAAVGGSGEQGSEGYAYTTELDRMIGGTGGGGGGGGGCSAPAIGAGGAGGSGGGSGGHPGSDQKGNVQGPGGGGGGGGWPNGGGGGGGGAECSDAEDKNDNKSAGGAGGSGGGVNGSGRSGAAGITTGTNGHGYNDHRYDAEPGSGGAGATGVQGDGGNGGRGGTEKDDKNYNGGAGGSGGKAVTLTAWHTSGTLIISTAADVPTTSFGDGAGKGTRTSLSPYVIYDLMDCRVNLTPTEYTYSGRQCRPTVQSVTYSASTDRDGRRIGAGDRTLAANRYSIAGYGENIHCPSGTVRLLGAQNSARTTITTDGAAVGENAVTFTIKKATLSAPVQLSLAEPYQNQSVTATLSSFTSQTAGSGALATLLRASSGKNEGPTVSWSFASASSGKFTKTNGLTAEFALTATGAATVRATLRDMNDFEDYTASISLTAREPRSWSASLSADTPHPRVAISVQLPAGISSASYQWYANGTALSGATGQSYVPRFEEIGKALTVRITPAAESGYGVLTVKAKNAVEAHQYSANGFCTVCGEYQPASQNSTGLYSVANGGQMFWFAAMVNGDGTHAVFSAQNRDANAALSAKIDLENREWTPIAHYNGTFSGNGYTIGNLHIEKTASYLGLFGSLTGTVRDFTVQGEIALSGGGVNRIGGAVGSADSAKILNVRSEVRIGDSGGAYSHVGGVVGGVDNGETVISRCIFAGEISLRETVDCVGGILGYSNAGARIDHCANLGTVHSDAASAYAGGILGYVNNVAPTVQNCYNYGAVTNGGGSYCGGIIGRVRGHRDANFTDNCYLDTSAPAAFGKNSNTVTAQAPAKTQSEFESGAVCYLINGQSSAADVLWRQNIDNGQTPYGAYPMLDGAVVYRNPAHHDCTKNTMLYAYSNTASQAFDHINHSYLNGFCTCCDAREAAQTENGVYRITNGGQLYWFAEKLNAKAIAQNSDALLCGEIGLEGSAHGQSAEYEGILKDRNFPGIGTVFVPYTGSFSGQGHTISDLFIENRYEKAGDGEGIGLFGCTNGAVVSAFTVQGKINLYAAEEKAAQRVGGAVGYATESQLREISSLVDITANGAAISHVGGVVGTVIGGSVTQCLFFGKIDLAATQDCVGGIAAYTNTAEIGYCASYGTVKTAAESGYVGGVLGYLNNKAGSVHNCYNYGTVQNGGGNYCGAVIGWLREHTPSKLTNNYYLAQTAPAGIGSGSAATTVSVPEKSREAFASGEVCYAVNGKTSTGAAALWKQDIDNGNTPYDIYPVFDAATVYYRSDGTYSNEPEKISVTIAWGDMEFAYYSGRWDAQSHTYSGGWKQESNGGNEITVQNDSNVALQVSFAFSAEQALANYGLRGTFTGVSERNRLACGRALTAKLALSSAQPSDLKDGGRQKLGEVTVGLSTAEGGGN